MFYFGTTTTKIISGEALWTAESKRLHRRCKQLRCGNKGVRKVYDACLKFSMKDDKSEKDKGAELVPPLALNMKKQAQGDGEEDDEDGPFKMKWVKGSDDEDGVEVKTSKLPSSRSARDSARSQTSSSGRRKSVGLGEPHKVQDVSEILALQRQNLHHHDQVTTPRTARSNHGGALDSARSQSMPRSGRSVHSHGGNGGALDSARSQSMPRSGRKVIGLADDYSVEVSSVHQEEGTSSPRSARSQSAPRSARSGRKSESIERRREDEKQLPYKVHSQKYTMINTSQGEKHTHAPRRRKSAADIQAIVVADKARRKSIEIAEMFKEADRREALEKKMVDNTYAIHVAEQAKSIDSNVHNLWEVHKLKEEEYSNEIASARDSARGRSDAGKVNKERERKNGVERKTSVKTMSSPRGQVKVHPDPSPPSGSSSNDTGGFMHF
jgi:hypothetical protein